MESTRVINKNSTKFMGLLFFFGGGGGFKWCNTLLWKLTYYDLRVFQNIQDKPNFIGIFKKAFPQPLCLFFPEQTTDRQIDLLCQVLRYIPCPLHCHWPRTFSWTSPKYLLHITSKIYVFLLFPNNLLVCNLKVFILTK